MQSSSTRTVRADRAKTVSGGTAISFTELPDHPVLAVYRVSFSPPPVAVAREGQELHVNVHVPHGSDVSVWIAAEDGSTHRAAQRENWDAPVDVDGVLTGRATFALPGTVPLGRHTLLADNAGTGPRCPPVVTPGQPHQPPAPRRRA